MLGVKNDDPGPDLHAQALDVLAKRVHAAEAGQEFEAPQGWGTQITASELAAFNAAAPKKHVEAVVDGAPVVFGMDDLFPVSASSPSEQQPID